MDRSTAMPPASSTTPDPLGLYRNEAEKMKQLPFHLIAKPAGPLCNLNCAYCFYVEKIHHYPGSKTSDFLMSDETLRLFVRQYIQRQPPQTRAVQFVWQGGEPTLLGVSFFRKAVRFQQQYKRKGMSVSNAFQTNGVLIDDEWCRFFKENQFLVGISIDGPEALHNRYRTFKNGEGSFAAVCQAVELLKNRDVEFNTLTCVQADNARYPLEVYSFLKSIGSQFMQFIPIVEPEINSEEERGLHPQLHPQRASYRSVPALQWGQFMSAIFHEWRKADIGRIFIQWFDNLLAMVCGFPASVCIFRNHCGRAMVIEHNGDIYSCDHFVFPENRIGNLHRKDLELIVNSEAQLAFGINKSRLLPEACRSCRWFRYCAGECPANRIIPAASGHPENALCEGYRFFFETNLPYFEAMKKALQAGKAASDYQDYL